MDLGEIIRGRWFVFNEDISLALTPTPTFPSFCLRLFPFDRSRACLLHRALEHWSNLFSEPSMEQVARVKSVKDQRQKANAAPA